MNGSKANATVNNLRNSKMHELSSRTALNKYILVCEKF